MAVMLLAIKTRNVIGAFSSVIVTVKQSIILSQYVSFPIILSLLVLLESVNKSFVRCR